MNDTAVSKQLKISVLIAGGIGLALRAVYYAVAMDEKGLLETFHWTRLLLVALTAAVAVLLAFRSGAVTGPENPRNAFPQSIFASLGCVPAAAAILFTTWLERDAMTGKMNIAALVLGIAAGLSLLDAARCRLLGHVRHWLPASLVCLYFTFRTVCLYRVWSSHPQMQDYLYFLLAYIALMIASYYHAAFSAGMPNHRALWISSLAAVYLCCLCVTNSPDPWLLGCCAVWMFTGLSSQFSRRGKYMRSREGRR